MKRRGAEKERVRMTCWMLLLALCVGCGRSKEEKPAATSRDPHDTLARARTKLKTALVDVPRESEPPETPPTGIQLVKYAATPGKLHAYVTADPGDGRKHPAIVWIVGGDTNSIGDVWSSAPVTNDQTAMQYRKAGIVMLYPSLRGGNDNPGRREGFLGEVDDVLAAADYLASLPFVDPAEIYLGGHSTGGTLALLVAASAPANKFRAIISSGPVENVAVYRQMAAWIPFDITNESELEVRAPVRWLHTIATPTIVLEGVREGNIESLRLLKSSTINPLVQFVEGAGHDHFDILAPANTYFASQIVGPWSSGPVKFDTSGLATALATK